MEFATEFNNVDKIVEINVYESRKRIARFKTRPLLEKEYKDAQSWTHEDIVSFLRFEREKYIQVSE